jgi:hypothetical protein
VDSTGTVNREGRIKKQKPRSKEKAISVQGRNIVTTVLTVWVRREQTVTVINCFAVRGCFSAG